MQWAVPELSIVIIYNSTWSILIQWIRIIIVRGQSDTKKRTSCLQLTLTHEQKKS